MIAESKTVPYGHDISLLLWVVISKHLQQFDLYLPLFVEFLLILQNFESHMLFLRVRMVHAAEDHPESTPTKFFDYFISVINLICCIIQVITIFSIESIIELLYRVILLLLLLQLLLLSSTILTII